MNINLIFGTLVFLLWSSFSSWYYVCKIKGLCLEREPIVLNEMEPPVVVEEPDTKVRVASVDTVAVEIAEPRLAPINRTEDKIYFLKNSTEFVDEKYVQSFASGLKSAVEGRQFEVTIVGFTCDLGRENYNLTLGQQRAEAMQAYLKNQNVNPAKFELLSKGESEASADSKADRQKDRKVSITIKSTDQ